MKLLHVIASCDRSEGGPVEGVIRLGEAFAAMGHQQELVTLDHRVSKAVRTMPMPVHALGRDWMRGQGPLAKLRRWARWSPEMVAWLRQHVHRYDGVIVDGLWNYATRAARLSLVGSGTPYIVFPHGMLDPWFRQTYPVKQAVKSLLWQFNEGPLLRGAQAVAFTCERERVLARASWRPWKIRERVVGFGTAQPPAFSDTMTRAFAEAVPRESARPYMLFLGRLHPKKGCDILLRAFGEVEAQSGYDLIVAGPSDPNYLHELQQFAQRHVPKGRVHFPGMLSGDAKWGALYGAEAMVLTSHQENFGVVVAEALGCGTPTIISDQVNISDEVAAADAGLVCEANVSSARAAMQHFAALTLSQKNQIGTNGKEIFAANYQMQKVAKRLIAIFEEARTTSGELRQ